ncbi:MAG: hypothetical protein Q7R79_03230, partial [bacterium]|nr:hypothetical protein [bacterium]
TGTGVGIGIAPGPFKLRVVDGVVRVEKSISMGGSGSFSIDAPGIVGGRFIVTGEGKVGIGDEMPGATLDVRRKGSGNKKIQDPTIENGVGLLVRNEYGDHSWGIVSEFRVDGKNGDKPSILFSNGTNNTTWSVGYGTNQDDSFRIRQNHGYRNNNWGTERFKIDTSGVVSMGQFSIYPGYLDNVANANWTTLEIPGVKGLRVWDNFSVDGNVGIGTTDPKSKLQVNGTLGLHDANGDNDSKWQIYGWDNELQFTLRKNDWSYQSAPLILKNDGSVSMPGLVSVGSMKLATGAGSGKVLTSDASGNATWKDTPIPEKQQSQWADVEKGIVFTGAPRYIYRIKDQGNTRQGQPQCSCDKDPNKGECVDIIASADAPQLCSDQWTNNGIYIVEKRDAGFGNRVGIGTTNPGGNGVNGPSFEIVDPTFARMSFVATQPTNDVKLLIDARGDGTDRAQIDVVSNHNLVFSTNDTGRMVIMNNGDVRIAPNQNSGKLVFGDGDNSKYIAVENWWMNFHGHGNEGWKFIDDTGDVIMQINGKGGNDGNVTINNALCLGGVCKNSWPSAASSVDRLEVKQSLWKDNRFFNLTGNSLIGGPVKITNVNQKGWDGDKRALILGSPDDNYFLVMHSYIVRSGVVGWGFATNGQNALVMTSEQRVGIGTNTPGYKLDVAGDINISYLGDHIAMKKDERLALATDRIGLDVAELFEAEETVEVGDVLVVGKTERKLRKSDSKYQSEIIGVVSGSPAILFEGADVKAGARPNRFTKGEKPPVALAGRVPVKVSLENGSIKPGDYLTTSSKKGVAMKATEPGATVGVALEVYDGSGEDTVLTFINIGEKNVSSLVKDLQKRIESLEKKSK